MTMDVLSYIKNLWSGITRKRSASEDFDIPQIAKIRRINYPTQSSIEDNWLLSSSNRFKRNEMETIDLTGRKPIFTPKKPHISSTPNVSKSRENSFNKTDDGIKRPEKFDYLTPSLFNFTATSVSSSFKNPRRFESSCYKLDEKRKYEELLASSMNGSANDDYCTPLGKISPITRTSKILKMACNNSKGSELSFLSSNGYTPKIKGRSSTKQTILNVLNKYDNNDVIVVKDSDSDVEILPAPPSPKRDFPIQRVNSLKEIIHPSQAQHDGWMTNKIKQHNEEIAQREKEIQETSVRLQEVEKLKNEIRARQLSDVVNKIMHIHELVVTEESVTEEKLPDLTEEEEHLVINAFDRRQRMDAVLASKFRLNITRRDMLTLSGLNWLNDEVINFYMNLIIERGKLDKYPTAYAFNTFFYPKILKDGLSSVARWTKKIDIFSYDLICVPIHMSMHWCMAIIDLRAKTITYYDSMGKPNQQCINALARYLQEEHMSKKRSEFDMTDWKLTCMKDIPQQMNGSDCGVFSCTYAEFITRNSTLCFSQDDMPYLRRKMVVEIIKGKLLLS